jgi:hypothetical protein
VSPSADELRGRVKRILDKRARKYVGPGRIPVSTDPCSVRRIE